MLICLVWYWLSTLFVKMILILLSPKSLISKTISSFNLLIKCQIHITFLAIYPSAIYSTLVVDMDTILYFLLLYETTTLLKKKQCLIIDFQSFGSPAKLLFTYLMKLYGDRSLRFAPSNLWLYINPSYIVFFKYCITLFIIYRWLFLRSKLYLLSCLTTKVISGLVPYRQYINLSIINWYKQSSIFHNC